MICSGNSRKLIQAFVKVRAFGKIYHFLLSSKGLQLQSTSLKLILFCMVSEENPVSWEHRFLSLSHNSFLQVRSFPQHNTFGVPQPSCWARMWSFQHPLQGGCPAQPDSKETVIKMQTFISCVWVEQGLFCSKNKLSSLSEKDLVSRWVTSLKTASSAKWNSLLQK